jgi:hypothetical protein
MLKQIQEKNYFILALYHTYMHEITKTPTRNPSEVSEQNYMVYLSIMIIIFFGKEMGFIGRKKRKSPGWFIAKIVEKGKRVREWR